MTKQLILATSVALLMTTGAAMAQSNANIWNGRDHQPTRTDTYDKEKAAGIEPPASERAAEDKTVDQLNRQLLGATPAPAQP
jgi:hypothetical protein